jgi:hypothetical protein
MVLAPLNMINILFRSGGSASLAVAPVGGGGRRILSVASATAFNA